MSDLPRQVEIHEEGPREGFQIEPGPIGSADKVRLIEALAQTGLRDIQVVLVRQPAAGAGLGGRRGGGAPGQAGAGRRLHGAVVQRQGPRARARLRRQAAALRRDLAVGLRGVHPQEPAPQPRREPRGDAQADRAAPRQGHRGHPHRRDGGVRLQFPGRHRARAGGARAGRRLRHRGRGGRERSPRCRSPTPWAGRRRCASSAWSARCASAGRSRTSRCTCTTRAGSRSPTRSRRCASA